MKNITKYSLGTFTYREEPRRVYTVTGAILGGVIGFTFPLVAAFIFVNPVMKVANAYAPTAELNKPVVTLPADPQSVQIENYIKSVFGKYSDRAFQLLTDPRCHENGKLNPQARNWNSDGSIDYGVMQLNDRWWGFKQMVNNMEMLFDYKINILIAHHIFVRDGYTFKAWTCGKALGI